jgi:hypothetical protein
LDDKCDFLAKIANKNLDIDKLEPTKLVYRENEYESEKESSKSSKLTNMVQQDIPDLTFHSSHLDDINIFREIPEEGSIAHLAE